MCIRDSHHAVEIGKGLIQLDAGELGVVLGVHALVAEDAANLVHAVHAAHDQALEVQLSLNAQHHVHVQAVVVGVEGTGGGDVYKRQLHQFPVPLGTGTLGELEAILHQPL